MLLDTLDASVEEDGIGDTVGDSYALDIVCYNALAYELFGARLEFCLL